MSKHWFAQIGSLVVAVICLMFAAPSHAEGELKGATIPVYLYPVGSPSAFFKEDLVHLYGLDVDIIREMQKRLGFALVEDRIFPIDYMLGLEKLENNELSLLGGGLSYTAARAQKYDYTPIYVHSSIGVVYSVVHNKGIKTLKDLRGKRIITDFNASNGLYVEYVKKFGAEPVEMSNLTYALFMVAQGMIDAVLYDRMAIEDFALNVKEAQLAVIEQPFGINECSYTFYMPKNGTYNEYFKNTMQEMIDDGTIARLIRKWRIQDFKSEQLDFILTFCFQADCF